MAQSKAKKANQPDHITIKFVKKARGGTPIGMWVKTEVIDGKFKQTWALQPQELH